MVRPTIPQSYVHCFSILKKYMNIELLIMKNAIKIAIFSKVDNDLCSGFICHDSLDMGHLSFGKGASCPETTLPIFSFTIQMES